MTRRYTWVDVRLLEEMLLVRSDKGGLLHIDRKYIPFYKNRKGVLLLCILRLSVILVVIGIINEEFKSVSG